MVTYIPKANVAVPKANANLGAIRFLNTTNNSKNGYIKHSALILLGALMLILFSGIASAATIHVGSGYTYSTIQSGIAAASSGDTVYVHPGTYTVTSKITLKSGIILHGDGNNTIIHGTSTSGGVINSNTSQGWIEGISVSNVEIYGFKFTSTATSTNDGGHGEARNIIMLRNSNTIKIHDCYIQKYQYNDFVKSHAGTNIQVYNNGGQCGHDFIEFLSGSKNCRAYNNNIMICVNSGFRTDGQSTGVFDTRIDHNFFTGVGGSGWCCLESQLKQSNTTADHNIFYNFMGSSGRDYVVGNVGASGSYLVQNNVIIDCGAIQYGTDSNNIKDYGKVLEFYAVASAKIKDVRILPQMHKIWNIK